MADTGHRSGLGRAARAWRAALCVVAAACAANGHAGDAAQAFAGATAASAAGRPGPAPEAQATPSRDLPADTAWAVFYGDASRTDIDRLATTFGVIVIDADPDGDAPNFTAEQIAALKAHGAKVLSYLNVGACETFRGYWRRAPAGFVPCGANAAARRGKYSGYAEYWMDPGNAEFQNLVVNYMAPRLFATGVDGFLLDNFEIVGHGANAREGPCDAACAQGGLDLVGRLRDKYPDAAIVLNHAPSAAIAGQTGGVAFPRLVDGVFAEQVFRPAADRPLQRMLHAWADAEASLGRTRFFTGTLDYVPSCSAVSEARVDWNASTKAGFRPAVATVALDTVCWWPFLRSAARLQ